MQNPDICNNFKADSDNDNKGFPAATKRLKKFLSSIEYCFKTSNSNQNSKARQIMFGLFQCDYSKIERMSEVVPDFSHHQIQHFISESPWDANLLIEAVVSKTSALFSKEDTVYLIVDESSHLKKGDKRSGLPVNLVVESAR